MKLLRDVRKQLRLTQAQMQGELKYKLLNSYQAAERAGKQISARRLVRLYTMWKEKYPDGNFFDLIRSSARHDKE